MTTMTVREFFKENYLDNEKIPQSFIEQYQGKVRGNSPQDVAQVVVGDLTFEYNGRRPKANKVMEYIQKEKGLNWFLFGTLDLATIDGKIEDIWNALHRAIIACVVLGPNAKVPALITQFNNAKEIYGTFWKHNGGRSQNVSPEQNHVSQIKSGEPEVQNEVINNILKLTNNTVVYVEHDLFEPCTNTTDWTVMVGPLKRMVEDVRDISTVHEGLELYQRTFAHTYSGQKPFKVVGQICQALTCILQINHEWLSKTTLGKTNFQHFENWLLVKAKGETDKTKWFYKEYIADRMEKKYLGTAFGIWKAFVHTFALSVSRGASKPTLIKMNLAMKGKIFTAKTPEDEEAQAA